MYKNTGLAKHLLQNLRPYETRNPLRNRQGNCLRRRARILGEIILLIKLCIKKLDHTDPVFLDKNYFKLKLLLASSISLEAFS